MQNKLKKMLSGVCAIVIASFLTTPLLAGSAAKFDPEKLKDPFGYGGAGASLGGPYLSIKGSINGSAMNGRGENTNGEEVKGSLGKVYGDWGANAGWVIPLGTGGFMLGLDVGIDPSDALIKIDSGRGDSDFDNEIVTLEIGETISASIMPMFAVTDGSAIYGKWGTSLTELAWTGDVDVNAGLNSSMRGDHYAIGSRTMLGANVYLQTELGANDFDKMSFTTNTGTGTARPRTAYGSLSLGIKY